MIEDRPRTAPERIRNMTTRELRAHRHRVSDDLSEAHTAGRYYEAYNELRRVDDDLRWRSWDRWRRVQELKHPTREATP